jgi:propionyl-CoA synthetase
MMELNICYLTLDKHIQDGYGDQTALFMIPSNTNYKKYTYSEVKPK